MSVRSFLPALFFLAFTPACSSAPSEEPQAETVTQAIVDGTDSPASQDFAVAIQTAGVVLCTGIAVTPTLVLTARHCVVDGDEVGTDFDSSCRLGTNVGSPSSYKILVGNDKRSPSATIGVKRLIVDFSKRTCADDLAAIELETPLSGITFPRLRMDDLPKPGDSALGIGWGTVDRPGGTYPDARKQQVAKFLQIDGTSFDTTAGTRLVPDGMVVSDISGCSGDSGGPALDANGNVVGIQSGGANVRPIDDAMACRGSFTLLVALARQAAFVERAHQAVGLMPRRAGHPDPAGLGGTCSSNAECNSNYCVTNGTSNVCSRSCATTACETGFECSSAPGFPICLPVEAKPSASCSVEPNASVASGYVAALIAIAGVLTRRRKPGRPS
jgi:hypothetical protein